MGDFKLMKDMHVNTIRIYTHPSTATVLTDCYVGACESNLLLNHPPPLTVLRDLFNTYGIRFMIGDEAGAYAGSSCITYPGPTDYTDTGQIQHMKESIQQMVNDYKNEPGLLMYSLGNENNYEFVLTNAHSHINEYWTFIDSMTVMIHSMDPNHPVATVNGEVFFSTVTAAMAPHIDVYAVNAYRCPGCFEGFSNMWQTIATDINKPAMLGEYGLFYPHQITPGGRIDDDSVTDQNYDAAVRKNYWCDIQNHALGFNNSGETPQNAIGGFNYSWSDAWWQGGDSNAPVISATVIANNSMQGIAANGNGTNSPYNRQLRASYFMYQRVWDPASTCECGTAP